jgi:putative oxidoreductase
MQAVENYRRLVRPVLVGTGDRWASVALTALRVIVGIFMIHNGLDKLEDMPSFIEAYVVPLGFPFPTFFGYAAALTELVAAPLLAVGLMTRFAAFGLFSTMAVAVYHHILTAGLMIPVIELSGLYGVTFLAFTVTGAGPYSLDAVLAGQLDRWLMRVRSETLESLETSLQSEPTTAKK